MLKKCSLSLSFLVIFLKLSTSTKISKVYAQNRIVNGHDARIEDFPYQLSLRKNFVHICGAAVLDTEWAITAAHCLFGSENSPQVFTLRIGSTSRSVGGEVISVNKIYLHPMYDADSMNFDVALLRSSPKKLRGDFVKPIRLPDVSTEIRDDTSAIISGWGHMSSAEQVLSSSLKYATVYTVNQDECDRKLENHGGITNAMFCAAARNTDACQGDSGGPIIVDQTLIGLVSWGVGCADIHYPGVYARLAYPAIRQWVRIYTRL